MTAPTLFRHCPDLFSTIPWLPLGEWPTPVHRLEALGKHLGVDLWIKRDDLSGAQYGGNKVRKLEFLLADAQRRERKSIITVGGLGSNHVIATGYYAQTIQLPTVAILVPQPMTPSVQWTIHLAAALGIRMIPCPSRAWVPFYLAKAKREADRPYLIPPGGSSPLGTLGYVSAALELNEQIQAGLLPEPDLIFIPLGSGGSATGLAIGLGLTGLKSRVIGVRVVERLLCNRTWLASLMRRTRQLLTRQSGHLQPQPADVIIWHDHFGGQYGRSTPEAESAMQRAYDLEGLILETTYTAKTLAALHEATHGTGRGKRILFWNTYNSRDTHAIIRTQPTMATLGQERS